MSLDRSSRSIRTQVVTARNKVFFPLVKEALGEGRHHRPHDLRHTWASLHLNRGTPIKWVQAQGGWTTAKVLLDTYADYMPEETRGFADRLFTAETHPRRTLSGWRPYGAERGCGASRSPRGVLRG